MIARLRGAWQALAPRERLLVGTALGLLFGMLVWALVWRPLVAWREGLERQVASHQATLVSVREAVAKLQSGTTRASAEPLLARADRHARAAGFGASLTRLAQEDGGRVRARFEAGRFDAIVGWLAALERDGGVRVAQLEMSRGEQPGLVDATLLLAP